MLSEEVPDRGEGIITEVIIPRGFNDLDNRLDNKLTILVLISFHHNSLQRLNRLLGHLLITQVLRQLTDQINKIPLPRTQLYDSDLNHFNIRPLAILDEELPNILHKDVQVEPFDEVLDVFQCHVLDLWGFVVEEREQRAVQFLDDVVEILGVKLGVTDVDLGNGEGHGQAGAVQLGVECVH